MTCGSTVERYRVKSTAIFWQIKSSQVSLCTQHLLYIFECDFISRNSCEEKTQRQPDTIKVDITLTSLRSNTRHYYCLTECNWKGRKKKLASTIQFLEIKVTIGGSLKSSIKIEFQQGK